MDTTDPEIRFDEQGHCNHCTDYLEMRKNHIFGASVDRKERAFQALVQSIKKAGRGAAYDCVMGISGGVDSCYTASLLHQAGLRVLLVHLDNGWDADQAVHNIQRVVDRFGFDCRNVTLDAEEFRDLQIAFLKASVIEAETPTDVAILGVLHRVAAEQGVKYIISGGNLATEGILPRAWHYNSKDTRYIKAIHKLLGSGKLTDFPFFGVRDELYFKFSKGIRMVYLLNYVDYNKDNVRSYLSETLDWEDYGAKHHESLYTKFVQSYLLPVKFNLDYRKATYSTQICAGTKTRVAALADLQMLPYNQETIDPELDFIAQQLQVSRGELDSWIALPPKNYRDYPNRDWLLRIGYRFYRWLRRLKKGI